ncbi:MAG: hypothetical protein ACD_80C00145G0041 [uncultured bacterium (gcode 4)]|uniref:Uncharacterized protein n=1 Tax=uncultured bacterium (gcode 4) TaxID=1234023 RepID=K1XIB9_9BACT|nr:MAG: hypothetical protein ACD_80C00145G0041 [uncultured bacterium (gcode 4)]HBB03739.1 hypothetical protein [Candidatus Gracilibacteria bacterium]
MDTLDRKVKAEIEATKQIIMNLTEAYIIVGGPQEQIIGTFNFKTMFIWTSLEKANDFIEKSLDPKEDKPMKKSMEELLTLARKLGFSTVRFDFWDKGCPIDYPFLNYDLTNGTGVLDLLVTFKSIS